MLRSDLCAYSDAFIAIKETIDLLAAAANENDKFQPPQPKRPPQPKVPA